MQQKSRIQITMPSSQPLKREPAETMFTFWAISFLIGCQEKSKQVTGSKIILTQMWRVEPLFPTNRHLIQWRFGALLFNFFNDWNAFFSKKRKKLSKETSPLLLLKVFLFPFPSIKCSEGHVFKTHTAFASQTHRSFLNHLGSHLSARALIGWVVPL